MYFLNKEHTINKLKTEYFQTKKKKTKHKKKIFLRTTTKLGAYKERRWCIEINERQPALNTTPAATSIELRHIFMLSHTHIRTQLCDCWRVQCPPAYHVAEWWALWAIVRRSS